MNLYEKSNTSIWSEPHIRKQLLAAHLNTETDAASRKLDTVTATIDWILQPHETSGKLIDLGCGPGLYTCEFAAHGWDVLGIDINKEAIDYANCESKARQLSAHHLEGSYLDTMDAGQFDLATCIYCDFGALTADDQRTFLQNVRQHLKPGGELVLDVFGKGVCETKSEGRNWSREEEGGFWSEQPCYVLSECTHFRDHCAWGEKQVVIPDTGKRFETIIWTHYFTAERITALLESEGFEVIETNDKLIESSDFISSDALFVRARKI